MIVQSLVDFPGMSGNGSGSASTAVLNSTFAPVIDQGSPLPPRARGGVTLRAGARDLPTSCGASRPQPLALVAVSEVPRYLAHAPAADPRFLPRMSGSRDRGRF